MHSWIDRHLRHFTVTYTSVSILVEDDSDMGSPGVGGPPSPDYMPGPEPEQAPPSPVYLPYVPSPAPVYPGVNTTQDDVILAERQLLAAGYLPPLLNHQIIPESDPREGSRGDEEEGS
ncbi:hypothetical protein Tco_0780720 [Tanacetum coccineum]